MFLRNYWYVAAWSDELSAAPLARTILGEPVVLFRGSGGEAVALENRCAHRRMPLVHGKVLGERLVCRYHGLAYDFTGRCVRIPGQASVPEGLCVRNYPVAERYGALWLWMGEPGLADPSKVFRCARIDPRGGRHRFYFHVKANYLYLNDNLSDLLHQAYLHNPSFGGDTDSLGETLPSVSQDGVRIEVKWDWQNVPVPGTFGALGGTHGRADGWNHSTYEPPCFYINHPGFAAAGTGGVASPLPQGAGKVDFTVYQLITPETERTTHFFKLVACDWPEALLPELAVLANAVNREDVWACEEQQRMEDLDPRASMYPIATDAPVTRMRRIVEELYAKEAQARSRPTQDP